MPSARPSGPRPRKSLGQHFLRDSGVLLDIAKAVRWPEGGCLVEVGPGTGQLTDHLGRRFRGAPNLRLVEGDARTVDVANLVSGCGRYAVVGNLPYFAANPIIRHFLEASPRPETMVVMVQREVAREIAAKSGDWSLLTISVNVYAEAELLFDVAPEAFDPPPNVWSSVVRLTLRPQPLVPDERNAAFFEFVSRVFRNPRKQIHNSLARGVWLPPEGARAALAAAGIDPSRRPETLDVADWLRLMDVCEEVRDRA
ncbi:MAG TPA: rRNA adenine dimethyltransferase family protein [Tepidiformaceae bacterium]|nr:rRNA adenine dimethyltransferase family protein [Tepidiformaceae bacterium]